MGRALAVILVATVSSLGPWVGPPQDVGLEAIHVSAPEFPSGPGPLPTTDLAGGSITGPAGGVQPGAIVGPDNRSLRGEATTPKIGVNWINSRPLSMAGLRGQVVMIDIWDPTSVGCIRTYPANKEWWDRYHRYGFQVVGVEDPEFDIPGLDVRAAVKRSGLPYPILANAHFWALKAYQVHSWPDRYLIDSNGYIRYHLAGEGNGAEFERAIQKLLKEAHPDLTFPESYGIAPDLDVFAPECGGAPTPEVYVGDWHGRGALANPEGYRDGEVTDYQPQASVKDGRIVLRGRWETDRHDIVYHGKHKGNEPSNDSATLSYHAREVYAVMNASQGHASRLYIMQDDNYLSAANKGDDVGIDSQGRSYIELRQARMYYVVQNPVFGTHTLAIFPTRPGLALYSFTFSNNCQAQLGHASPSGGA